MLNDCNILLNNLERLEALNSTGLFGTKPEEAFTRLNHLATKILNAPISIFSLIGKNTQFFKSAVGYDLENNPNEFPIDISVCQYSLHGQPLSIEDTKNHPFFSNNPAVHALNIGGYLGIPVITKNGQAIGAVCVIDHKKRSWTAEEIAILEDITASFISEIELRQAIASAEREIKLREEFIAIASHELKNPLSALKLQTQLTQMKLGKGQLNPADNQKFLSNLERQTSRLELMIDDMSDSARLSTGKFSLYLNEMNLYELMTSVVDNQAEYLTAAKCKLNLLCDENIVGIWDSARLEQVITNIVSNAIKYAPGSLISIDVKTAQKEVTISVTDSGPGISLENQKNVFMKYGRVNDSSNVKGLGLGLYISKQIIEEHSGTLELLSEEGKGSTFIIHLPLNSAQ